MSLFAKSRRAVLRARATIRGGFFSHRRFFPGRPRKAKAERLASVASKRFPSGVSRNLEGTLAHRFPSDHGLRAFRKERTFPRPRTGAIARGANPAGYKRARRALMVLGSFRIGGRLTRDLGCEPP